MLTLALFLPAFAFGLFENNPVVQELSIDAISKEVENPDFLVVSIIFDSLGYSSKQLARTLTDLTPKFVNYAKFFAFDCRTHPEVCKEEVLENLPSIIAYVPDGIDQSTGKPIVHERSYQGNILVKDLGEFISANIPYLGASLNARNLLEFTGSENNKAILFTNKETVPVLYRGISSKFRGRLDFGVVSIDSTEIIQKYEVSEYPTLIVLQGEAVHRYSSKYDFSKISDFLEKFASDVKKPQKQLAASLEKHKFEVISLTPEDFLEKISNVQGVAIVHFYKDKPAAEWENFVSLYNGIATLFTISCSDHDFCTSQNVKKFPSLRLFPSLKTRKSMEISFTDKEEIVKELKFEIQSVEESMLPIIIKTMPSQHILLCLYIGEGEVPVQFKGLAAMQEFKGFVKFIHVNIPHQNVKNYIEVQKYPTVVSFIQVNTGDDLKVLNYNGEVTDFPSLYYFVDQVGIPKFLDKQPEVLEEDQDEVDFIADDTSFHNKCLKKTGFCVIGVLDQNRENYEIFKYVKAVMQLRKLPLQFVWIDGTCQKEFCGAFSISENNFPTVAMYFAGKKMGTISYGKYAKAEIFKFVEGVLRGSIKTYEISDVQVADRVCKEGKTDKKKRKSNWKSATAEL